MLKFNAALCNASVLFTVIDPFKNGSASLMRICSVPAIVALLTVTVPSTLAPPGDIVAPLATVTAASLEPVPPKVAPLAIV